MAIKFDLLPFKGSLNIHGGTLYLLKTKTNNTATYFDIK
jgi:hypothetical protein